MTCRVMFLPNAQLARLLGLVRAIKVVKFERAGRPGWGVLVRGRGFDRLIQDDILFGPTLIWPLCAYIPRPRSFHSPYHAQRFIESMGQTSMGWLMCCRITGQ